MFNLFSGEPPFPTNKTLLWLVERKAEAPPRLDQVVDGCPPDIVALVAKMMDPDASMRPRDYAEILSRIEKVQRHYAAVDFSLAGLKLG